MANAYSLLDNFDAPLYSPDFQSISTALTYKQNKLDMNRAALDQMYSQITDLDILKGVDKEYADKRIATVTDIVNQYANQDLSNDGLAKSLQADLTEILDDNVKNAVYSTALYRAEEAEWDKLKEENRDKYAEQNYWYAHKGFNNYMNDERVGVKYQGGGGVIEYQDVAAKINKNLPDMLKDKGIDVKLNKYGEYYWTSTKVNEISEAEVMSAIEATLDDKDRSQLMINANYNYKDYSDEKIIGLYNNNRQAEINSITKDLETIETQLKLDITKEQADYLNQQKEQLTSYKKSLATAKTPSRIGIENALYSEEFFTPFKKTYSRSQTLDFDIINDPVGMKKLDFAFDLKKMDIEHQNAKEMLALENMLKNTSKGGGGVGGSAGLITNEGYASPEGVVDTATVTDEDYKPHYSALQDETDGLYRKLMEQGVLPDMYSKSDKQVEYMQIISNFNPVAVGTSTDGTKNIYQTGIFDHKTGKPKTIELTAEQADDMYKLSRSMFILSETETQMVQDFDKAAKQYSKDLIKFNDVETQNLVGFNFKVKTLENGDEILVPVDKDQSEWSYFSNLVIKARDNKDKMTDDEWKTLELYCGLDAAGSMSYNEDNADSSLLVDGAQAWLQRTSLKYKNGGDFISTSPNDYNVWNDKAVEQVVVSHDAVNQVYPDLAGGSGKAQELFTALGGDASLAQSFVAKREAYDKIMQTFYDGKNVMNRVNKIGSSQFSADATQYKVDANIDKLINLMLESGQEISNYEFSPSEKELIHKANTNGVGRTYQKNWSAKQDLTLSMMDNKEMEYHTGENMGLYYDMFYTDYNSETGGGSGFQNKLNVKFTQASDRLGQFHKGTQNKALIYTKDSDAGQLLKSDLENVFENVYSKAYSGVEIGDKFYINYTPDGNLAIFGDITKKEGDTKIIYNKENPILIDKAYIPESVPPENIAETTTYNTALPNPNQAKVYLNGTSSVNTIAEIGSAMIPEIDKASFSTWLKGSFANDGEKLRFEFKPVGDTYGSVVVLPITTFTEQGEMMYPTEILLEDTGLPNPQEKGQGGVLDIIKGGSNLEALLNHPDYGQEIMAYIMNSYIQGLIFQQQNTDQNLSIIKP